MSTFAPPAPPENEQPDEEQEVQPTDYGPANRDLPEQLVDAIKAAVKTFSEQERFTRRREVMHDRRNRFYERGFQHIYPGYGNNQGFTMGSPGGYIQNATGQTAQLPQYIDDYDIFGPYLWILVAILTQNPPGVNFQPIDPSIPEDIDKARNAENYSHTFDRMNDSKQIQADIIRMMALSGRTVSWTRTEQDAQRFGYEADGTTPKTFQRTTIHGTLETKVPILAREIDKDFLYCIIYDDPDEKAAKNEYPDFEDEIRPNVPALGESMYERTARLGVLNGTRSRGQVGDTFSHLCSRAHCFLRPAAFTGKLYDAQLELPGETDVSDTGEAMTVKEKLNKLFPDGCRAVFVGETYVGSFNECLDDHIDIRFPFPGDGMFRKAIMDPMVIVQDGFSDGMNAARENFDTGWPSLWVNADQAEYDAITSQKSAPNAIRQKKVRHGMKLPDEFFREGDPELPATFMQYIELLQDKLPQFQLSTPPASFGEEMKDQKTASGYAQARNQATGRLGLIWQSIQHMFARIRYQSVLAASKSEAQTGQMSIPGGKGQQSVSVDLDALKKGNFGCYPDEDSSFPESTQQKRATMSNLVTMAGQSPAMMQMLDTPGNVEEILRLNGFEELEFTQAEAWRKQIAEIELLLQQAPLPPAVEEVQGAMVDHAAGHVAAAVGGTPPPGPLQPPPMQPSIPIDKEMDFHQYEWAAGQVWWSSSKRREEEQRGNVAGLQNVKLHLLGHRAEMVMAMAAAAPPPAPVPHPGPHAVPPKKTEPSSAPAPAPAAPPAVAA